jgi:hypothetical protein
MAEVMDSEADVFDSEAERLLAQARTAEQRARTDGSPGSPTPRLRPPGSGT